jgi:hypothetical protein
LSILIDSDTCFQGKYAVWFIGRKERWLPGW